MSKQTRYREYKKNGGLLEYEHWEIVYGRPKEKKALYIILVIIVAVIIIRHSI